MKRFLKYIVKLIAQSKLLYAVTSRLVYAYRNENDADITINGELSVMKRFLPSARVVFDVGANIGEWTSDALSINPNLVIHCFEPIPSTYAILKKTHESQKHVTINNLALSSQAGKKIMFTYEGSSPINSIYARSSTTALPNKQEIQTETIDNYCSSHAIQAIDFLKIDVEGHEFEVLQGAKQMLQEQRIKVIQFEYGGTYIDAKVFLKDIFNYVRPLKYDVYKIYLNRLVKIQNYQPELDNFQMANYLLVSTEVKI